MIAASSDPGRGPPSRRGCGTWRRAAPRRRWWRAGCCARTATAARCSSCTPTAGDFARRPRRQARAARQGRALRPPVQLPVVDRGRPSCASACRSTSAPGRARSSSPSAHRGSERRDGRARRSVSALRGGVALPARSPARCPHSAASLPSVQSGQRPGPPLLYAPQPRVPQLSVRAPFTAPPLLVSGTDAYGDGEYVYQDYLFDDHGADVKPGGSTPPGSGGSSQTAGDVLYPTAARFANNAADLVELRIKPTPDGRRLPRHPQHGPATTTRPRWRSASTRDRSGGVAGAVAARRRHQLARHRSLHRGVGHRRRDRRAPAARASALPAGAVRIDLERNQMTISVPRSTDGPRPGHLALRRGRRPVERQRLPGRARGDRAHCRDAGLGHDRRPAPAIFNLAFRFDEPQARGQAVWFEDAVSPPRSRAGPAAPFRADVDFARLGLGPRRLRPRARAQAGAHPALAAAGARGSAGRRSRSSAAGSSPTSCTCRRATGAARPTAADLRPALGRRQLHAVRRRFSPQPAEQLGRRARAAST